MTALFFDTSALVKRYAEEPGSGWVRAFVAPALPPLIVVSHLLIAEMTSAFNRRLREGAISTPDYTMLMAALRGDCLNDYHVVPVNRIVIDTACSLMERHPLHTLDAIHLASALVVKELGQAPELTEIVFVAADVRLLAAASAEGLAVENPANHA